MGRFRTGDEFEGVVCDFGMSGEGIVKDGAYPIFVPFAIVGERVRLRVVHAKKDYAFGELIEVLTPSNERVKPRCRHFGRCGGCDLQHLSHAMQEEVKRVSVERTMKKAGVDVAVPEVIAGNPWAYRNKLALPFGRMGRHGKIVLGFFEKKSHRVVPLKECPLHGAWASDVVAAALYVSPNKAKTNVIMGESVRLVKGREVPQRLGAFSAVVSPASFLQVNDEMRERLYAAACAALDGFDGDIVELYSGVGLLTAELALRLPQAKIAAVEIVPEAVKDAEKLMSSLGLSERVTEVCCDAADYMRSLAGSAAPRALLVDPPRKGCDEAVLSAAAEAEFQCIVYISCNPATLARDLKFLTDRGYALTLLQPFDLFPETMHVETLAVLERQG